MRTVEFKIYPSPTQVRTLESWISRCCWVYNRALEHRTKAYKRRKKSVSYNDQSELLTQWRSRLSWLKDIPTVFARDALRRVERGMKSFFRRVKAGEKPGFPRFRSRLRYSSLECLQKSNYVIDDTIRIPKLGHVKARGPFDVVVGKQKMLRVVKRASGWYAQVVVEQVDTSPLPKTGLDVGIDLGLESFLTTDNGEQIGNPRHLKSSAKKLKRAQQKLCRRKKGSNRRKQAVRRVARIHERVQRQRSGFVHRISRDLVKRFDRIAVEDLNIKGLARGMLAKSVLDACWGKFVSLLTYKAESAGRELVKVNPAGTSQTCPRCGAVKHKELKEREHVCSGCGYRCHRDHAAAQVVLQRAFRPARGESVRPVVTLADSANREGSTHC